MRKRFEEIYNEIDGDFGSCQYETAAKTYNALKQLVQETSIKQVMEFLGYSDWAIRVKADLIEELEIEDIDTNEKLTFDTIEAFYEEVKNQAWDLWSAFIPIEQTIVGERDPINIKLETIGPILNQLCQEDNFEVGVSCFILNYFYGVSEDNFIGFDT